MNIVRSSSKLFLANTVGALVSFLGIAFFSRELGAAQIGVFFLFKALIGMLSIPADFGLRGALEKRISENEMKSTYLSSAIIIKLVPLSVIVVAILLFRNSINAYLGAELALFLAVAVVLQEAALLVIAVLNGELRVGETAVLRALRKVLWAGIGGALVFYGFGVHALIYGLLIGFSVIFIWGWFKRSTPLSSPSVNHAYSLFDYGRYNIVSSIGGYFYSWVDVAVIGFFLSQSHVGAYEVAWRLTAVVMLFSQAIATTIFPQISRWDATDAKHRIEAIIPRLITPSLIIVIPSFFGTLTLSRDILRLVFGTEFTMAWPVLIILMGEKVLQSVHVVLGRSLQGIDRPDLAAKATAVSVTVNVLLNIGLVFHFGMVGAAIATAVSFSINTLLHGYYLSKFVEITFPYSEIGWLFVSSLGMVTLILVIRSVFAITTLTQLLGVIILGALWYGVSVLTFRPLREKAFKVVKTVTPS